MARTCTICGHSEREAIDQALVSGTAMRPLAALYRVSPDAMERHAAAHLPQTLTKAQDAREVAHADDLLAQVTDLQARTLAILGKAEQADDLRTALSAVAQARGNLELLAKLTGELAQDGAINVLLAPEWVAMRSALLLALQPFPEARLAVAAGLLALESA